MSFADRPGLAAGPRQQSSWRNAPPPANTGVNFGRRSGGNLRRRLTQISLEVGYARDSIDFRWRGSDEGDQVEGEGTAELLYDGTIAL
jgi:hypothetical protein